MMQIAHIGARHMETNSRGSLHDISYIARAMGGEAHGNQALVPGPGHTRKDRSLSIKPDASAPGGFLVQSFAGDDPLRCKDYVRERLGLPTWRASAPGKSIAWTYDYTNEAGELLVQVVRYIPKNFRQRQPDGKGGWKWSLKGARRVLYRLPDVIAAVASKRTIFITEGEKAADALAKLGLVASCSLGGAGKWRNEYSQYLAGADVVILPDNDEPGEQHCKAVANSLAGVAESVRFLHLPRLPAKGDAYDWVQAGGTAEQLWQLVKTDATECPNEDAVTPNYPSCCSLVSRRASEIRPEPVEWLWSGRIARGKHTCIAGEPGTGKSQLSVAIAAAISTGGEWPCDEGRPPLGSVIILSAEDGAADTIVPRLIAAGANLDRIHIVSAVRNDKGRRGFDLKADLDELENKIAEIGDVMLVVIDPISSYMGKTDSHKNSDVRGVLEPIAEMAERTGVAVCSVTHFSKPNAGKATKALHKFIGSIAFVAAARAAFAVLEDPNDKERRLFLHAKNNLAEPPRGLAFRLEQVIVAEGIVTSRVDWEPEPITTTADEALVVDDKSSLALAEAGDFLEALLADGPVPSKEVDAEAEEAGITKATLRRAKASLGITSYKDGMKGGWVWELPKTLHPTEDAHPKEVSTFGTDEHLREATKATS
jgi:putative DNA primase/helicase